VAVGKLPIRNIHRRILIIDICVSQELQSFKMEMSGRFTVKETAEGRNCLFRSIALPAEVNGNQYIALRKRAAGHEYVRENCNHSVNL
jgi:hypothetical protein